MLKLNDKQKRWLCGYLDWADDADPEMDDPEYSLIHVNTALDWYLLAETDKIPAKYGAITTEDCFIFSLGAVSGDFYHEYDVITQDLADKIIALA